MRPPYCQPHHIQVQRELRFIQKRPLQRTLRHQLRRQPRRQPRLQPRRDKRRRQLRHQLRRQPLRQPRRQPRRYLLSKLGTKFVVVELAAVSLGERAQHQLVVEQAAVKRDQEPFQETVWPDPVFQHQGSRASHRSARNVQRLTWLGDFFHVISPFLISRPFVLNDFNYVI